VRAVRCSGNTFPIGITTQNKRLQRGLVEEKYQRLANRAPDMNKEIELITHPCGFKYAL